MTEQLDRIRAAALEILAALDDGGQQPGALRPPTGFTAEWDAERRRMVQRWTDAPGAVWVQAHESEADQGNTLKATVPAAAGLRESSELRGGRYRWALRSVGPAGELSDFTEWIVTDVPLKGDEHEDPDDDEDDDEPEEPQPGGPHPDEVLPVLKHWTIMLPTGSAGDPDNEYVVGRSIPNTYFVREDEHGRGVVFRVHPATANRSKNSKYGRAEGRQMVPGQKWVKSAWPSGPIGLIKEPAEPQHLHARMRIDASRLTHAIVNGAQIHDGGDDVMQVQSRNGVLGIAHDDGDSWEVVDPSYGTDGDVFDLDIRTTGRGEIVIDYNGAEAVRIPKTGTGWYWKSGCYPNTGGANAERPEDPAAYAEVVIYELDVSPR